MKNFGFSGVQFIPGVGYVEVGEAPMERGASRGTAPASLGDDSAVMMISGLGRLGNAPVLDARAANMVRASGRAQPVSSSMTILGISLPTWVWLLIGAGVVGAGWYFFGRKGKS